MNIISTFWRIALLPKTIVQYWDQGLPEEHVRELTETWVEKNPSYEYKLFNRVSAEKFILSEFGSEELELFQSASLPAMRSDIFRIAYILKYGGTYVDAATKCFKSLDGLSITKNVSLVLMRKWHGRICNGFFSASSGNVYVEKIWFEILDNLKRQVHDDVWACTGPGVFISVLSKIEADDILAIDQSSLKPFFQLIGNLAHKKQTHWSSLQKSTSIFNNINGGSDKSYGFYIHLGPHKTGTTSFQGVLEEKESLLDERGFSLVTVRSSNSGFYKLWRSTYISAIHSFLLGAIDALELKKRLINKLFILKEEFNGRKMILSDENLLGPMPGHFFAKQMGREKGFYSAYQVVLEAMNIVFGKYELRVSLCERNVSEMVLSFYRDFAAKLMIPEDLTKFNDNFRESFIREYKDFYHNLGVDVYVFSFDEFRSSMDAIVSEFLGEDLDESSVAVKNISLSWRAVAMSLKVIPFLKSSEDKAAFRRFLFKFIKGDDELLTRQINLLKKQYNANVAKNG